jgi:hypothetical protein
MAKYTMKRVSLAEYWSTQPCNMTLFQVISLKTLLLPCHGPMLFPMVGPWSGTRPRPTLIIPSDVMPGLRMMSVLATCIVIVF